MANALEQSYAARFAKALKNRDLQGRISELQGLKIEVRSWARQPVWVSGFCSRADRAIMAAQGEIERVKKLAETLAAETAESVVDEAVLAAA